MEEGRGEGRERREGGSEDEKEGEERVCRGRRKGGRDNKLGSEMKKRGN